MDSEPSPESPTPWYHPKPEDLLLECQPIRTVEELYQWKFDKNTYKYTPANLLKGFRLPPNHGQVMLVHDMKGGYLDDRFIFGNKNFDAFRFFHWHLIDWFVYFAHHLVTIPPPGWIELSHKNGVPILGTFITEWDEGKLAFEEILSSPSNVEKAVHQLLLICKVLNFDGWFVNIEHKVRSDLLEPLNRFLKMLFDGGILVVWYDSVITSGELKWQNELNHLNYPFAANLYNSHEVEQRGRIFLNYTWKPDQLTKSINFSNQRHYPAKCVHVGIDVFGRGCLGGGGMNCDVALKELWKRPPLSIGLFAPGWVYETQPETSDDKRYVELFHRTVEFWSRVQDLLGGPRRIVGNFSTNFSMSQGPVRFLLGNGGTEVTLGNDLRRQEIFPHFYPPADAPYKMEIDREMAYSGSNSLRIEVRNVEPVVIPLFATWRDAASLGGFEVVTRFPKSGPSPEDRVLALVVKCRNQDVDSEETPATREKRRRGETDPDEDLFRVMVIAMVEGPSQIRKQLLHKIRIHCIEHERMDELCTVPFNLVESEAIVSDCHRKGEEEMEEWFNHSIKGFGTPGSLPYGKAMAYEFALLVWDLRNRPSAAAQFDRYTQDPTEPLWFHLSYLNFQWLNCPIAQRLLPYSRDDSFY